MADVQKSITHFGHISVQFCWSRGLWQQPRFTSTQQCKSSPDRTGSSQSWLAAFRSHYVTIRHSSEFMKTRHSGFNYLILCRSPSGSARRHMCTTTMQRHLWTQGGKRKYKTPTFPTVWVSQSHSEGGWQSAVDTCQLQETFLVMLWWSQPAETSVKETFETVTLR